MCLSVLVAAVACVLCGRAINAEHRAKRIASCGVGSGVGALSPVIFATNCLNASESVAFKFCTVVATGLAILSLVLSLRALLIRRNEGGVAAGIPMIGLLCAVAGIVGGIGVYLIGGRILIPANNTPWTWRCENHALEVTIPSERWLLKPNPNVLGEFRSSRPSIVALVAEARPSATEHEFERALAFGRKMQSDTPTKNTFDEKGKNAFGNEYWIYMGDAKSAENSDYFFGFSITRVGDKSIVMLLEGRYGLLSQVGRAQEVEAVRAQAKTFLSSAR